MVDVVEVIDKNSDTKIIISEDKTEVVHKADKLSDKQSNLKCVHCSHEKRFHVNTENHDICKTSQCTKLSCYCQEFVEK